MASTPENLYVTYVDVDRDLLKIWVQRNRIGATYIERQLLQLLPEFNKTMSPNPNRIHKGMFCFAKYTDDNYYRARVISRVQEDSVGVLFVDYGNRDVIKLSNIRVQEGSEGDVLAKMSEQAEEYYLAKTAAPPSGWTVEIISEIRRLICYDEFLYQIIAQVGDQKILDIKFRDEDLSSYLVKKQLARPLSLPVQRELILSYCSLVSNEVKHDQTFRDSQRVPFSPSVPPPSLRVPLRPANAASDMNMQLNYTKVNSPGSFSCPPQPGHYPPPRQMRAPLHLKDQNIPKSNYYSPVNQIHNQMVVDPITAHQMNANSFMDEQLNQLYQMQENAASCANNSNIIELLAQQVKQYIAKDNAKTETENVPHHYVSSVLEVGNTYNAVISYIDDGPWSFSIQLLSSKTELKKLMNDLSTIDLVLIKPPIILGHSCIAPSSLHGALCRGVVVSISRSAVKVYFVDFGNTEDLPSTSIYELPPKFFKVGVLSQKFSLSGLQKVAYSEDIKKFFREVVKDEALVLRVESLEGDNLPTCELYIKQRNIKRILNEKMRELKNSTAEEMPKVGDTEGVLVTWVVSPQNFYVQMKKRDAELNMLKKELSEVEIKGQPLTYQQLTNGLKCVCQYKADGHWYRAVITSIDSENAITVFYVDYGNTEIVSISFLRKVDGPGLINQLGNQAIQCCLKGFENQPYNPDLAKRLEALILEKEFQMTVAGLNQQLLYVHLFDNGNDIASVLLLTQNQSQMNEPETPTLSEGSVWDSPEPRKAITSNKFEPKAKPHYEEFERKDSNFRHNQMRKKNQGPRSGNNVHNIQTPARASPTHLKSRFDSRDNRREGMSSFQEKDNRWDEPKFDQTKTWNSRGPKEFGSWDSGKVTGSRGPPRGRDGSNDSGRGDRSGGFGRNRTPIGREGRRRDEQSERKFGENRGRRFDGERRDDKEGKRFMSNRGGEDSRRRFGDRNEHKFEDTSRVAINSGEYEIVKDNRSQKRRCKPQDDVAPPGSKFEQKAIELGGTQRGIVTYYFSPDEFFVQLLDDEEDFKKMMKEMQSYYSDKQSIATSINTGDIVIAQFSFDKILYRAEVIKSSPVTVRYVDYGNQEPVPVRNIWQVDKRFLRLPQQVVKCRLKDLQPVGSDWPPPGSAVDKFFEFSEYKCTFLSKEGDMHEIILEAVDNGKDMRSEIIAAGLGRPLDPKLDIPEVDFSLLQNQILRLKVSHVESSSKFYVVINSKACELITEAISAIVDGKSLSPMNWFPLESDMPCLVTTDDVSWHRGNIKKTDEDFVSVWLCDRGDCVETTKEKVSLLPDFLKNFEPQVVECSLKMFSGDEETFKSIVESNNLLVHIISATDKRLSVVLYDEEGRLFDFEKDCDAPQTIEPIAQLPIINQQIPLVISQFDSINEVYIQRITDEDDLMSFLEQLNNHYEDKGEDFQEGETIAKDSLLAAKSDTYKSWYRGRLLSSTDGELEVFYIDYGNKETLPRENVKKLDSSFLNVNAFCRRLTLDVDVCSGREEEINNKIWEICEDKDLVGYFKNNAGEIILDLKINEKGIGEVLQQLDTTGESTQEGNTTEETTQEANTTEEKSSNDGLRVLLTHIDTPNCFWVHKEASINELQQFQDKLQKIAGVLPDKKNFNVNDIIAAVFSEMWYRARITDVGPKSLTVQFIDYGNTSVVDLESETVKELTEDLVKVPIFATRFALTGNWNENSTSKFEEIILRNEDLVSVKIVDDTVEPVVVDLFQNGRSIAEMLLEEITEVGDDLSTVYITHSISPRDFYIQRETSTAALNKLTEELLNASSFEDPVSVDENELYAAKYPEDENWYRARVTYKTGKEITVHFIDYGNTSTITEIKRLPGELATVPNLSENCCLVYGNTCDSWSDTACDMFAEYSDGRALQMKVVGTAGRRSVVKLFHENRSISEELEAVCENDGRVEMYVSHAVSPTEFYIQYVDDPQYKIVEEALKNGDETQHLEDRTIGTLCIARFIEDGLWYRAKILQDLGPDGFEVIFYDFGNISLSKELKKLPPEVENIPSRALKCSLDLGETVVEEPTREEFITLTAAGAAVFRGRILSEGETNIVSLKIDGRIIEEMLRESLMTERSEDGHEESGFSEAKDDEMTEGEAETTEEDILVGEREPSKEKYIENGVTEVEDGFRMGGRNKVNKIVPGSISRGEEEEFSDENVVYKKTEFSERIIPGCISRGASLELLSDDGGKVTEVRKESKSAPNTPRPPRKREYVKKTADDRLIPGCISTGIPLHCSPLSEKTSLNEKIVPGAVNGSVGE